MDCPKCHKHKTEKEHSCNSPKVIQVCSPSEIVTFHTVVITANMGDETTIPPVNGRYKNTIVEYAASSSVYLYNSDGIPVKLTPDALRDFNKLVNRPKFGGVEMTSDTDIPDFYNDLATVAFSGQYTDLINAPQAFTDIRWADLWDEESL